MYRYMISYLAAIIYSHISMNETVVAYLYMVSYKSTRLYNGMLSYLRRWGYLCNRLLKGFEELGELIEIPKGVI